VFREHEHENLGSADRSHDAVGVERSRDNVPRGNPALKSVALQGRNDGGWPPPDSGASPDIPCPLDLASCGQDAPGAMWPATCGLTPAFIGTWRNLAEAVCRGMPAYR